jgi:hypothetical protein
VVETLIHPGDQIRQRAAAVRGDDLELPIAVEKAIENHSGDGERRVEREADRGGQLETHHVHFSDAWRRGGMHKHRQRLDIDRRPRFVRRLDR